MDGNTSGSCLISGFGVSVFLLCMLPELHILFLQQLIKHRVNNLISKSHDLGLLLTHLKVWLTA